MARGKSSRTVHPRLRGELSFTEALDIKKYGSSPLARGTQSQAEIEEIIDRFIPACAGNSKRYLSFASFSTVHPRLRGELAATKALLKEPVGSSPLARGTRYAGPYIKLKARFIPACAGNSLAFRSIPFIFSVHPRLRGELETSARRARFITGSSPLARGTHLDVWRNSDNERFIPACAGNSPSSAHPWRKCAVHPRLRGELSIYLIFLINRVGSSPLARGTLILRKCKRN